MSGAGNPLQIALITYNRPRYLHRQLEFFSQLGNPYPIRILDGSDASRKEDNRRIAARYDFAVYRAFPQEMSPVERIHRGIEDVDAPYLALCADDDLIHPNGYRQCLAFLETHPEYNVAVGRILALLYARRSLWIGYLLEDHLNNSYDVRQAEFGERIVRLKQAYEMGCPPIFYAVRRTRILQAAYSHWNRFELYSSVELIDKIYTVLDGGAIVLDHVFFGFRDYGSEPIREGRRNDPRHYFNENDARTVREILAGELSARGIAKELVPHVVDQALRLPLEELSQAGKPLRPVKSRLLRLARLMATKYFTTWGWSGHGVDSDTARALRRVQSLIGNTA